MSPVPDAALECASGSTVEVDARIKAAPATVPHTSTALRVHAPAALTTVVPVNGVLAIPMRDIKADWNELQHATPADPIAWLRPRATSLWSRFLNRILRPRKTVPWTDDWHDSSAGGARPIFRIRRVKPDLWMVARPASSMEHGCDDLAEAGAFVRYESRSVASTVELHIDDLYVVAYFDPARPSSLFGERVI